MGLDHVQAFSERCWQRSFHFRGDEADVEHVADVCHVFEPVAGELHLEEVSDGNDAYLPEAFGLADFRDGGEIVRANFLTAKDEVDGAVSLGLVEVEEHVDTCGVGESKAVFVGKLSDPRQVLPAYTDIHVAG